MRTDKQTNRDGYISFDLPSNRKGGKRRSQARRVRNGLSAAVALALLSAGMAASGGTEEKAPVLREYECRLLAKSPEVDGRIDGDPAWDGIPAAGDFRDLRTGFVSPRQTRFRAGYTADGLYFGIVLDEPDPKRIRAALPDGESFYEEDSVMVSFALREEYVAEEGRPRLAFWVNAIGSRNCHRTLKKWKAAAAKAPDNWSLEIFLPWDVLGGFPENDAKWQFNVLRFLPSDSAEPEYSTWADLEYRLFERGRLATLRFQAMPPALRQTFESQMKEQARQSELLVFSRHKQGLMVQSEFSKDRLAYNDALYLMPQLSPDLTRVMYTSVEGGPMGIWVIARSGDVKQRICDGMQGVWAHDGRKILLVRDGRLVEHVLDSGEEKIISPPDAPRLKFPSYAPPGQDGAERLVCVDEEGRNVYMLQMSAGRLELLVTGEIGSRPRLSPDGGALAYQDGAHICLMTMDSRKIRRVTSDPGVQGYPVWSADGAKLGYARTRNPATDNWEICLIDLKEPRRVDLIEPQVHPGFDWSGAALTASRSDPSSGVALEVWTADADYDPLAPPQDKSGWDRVIEETIENPAPARSVLAENDWVYCGISQNRLVYAPKQQQAAKPIEVFNVTPDGQSVGAPWTIARVERIPDSCTVAFTDAGSTGTGAVRLLKTRPVLEMKPIEGTGLKLRGAFRFIIVPDRYANDLIISPAQLAAGTTVAIPQTPIVLACMADSGAMLMLTTREGTSFTATAGADGRSMESITAMGDEGAAAALLCGQPYWSQPKIKQDAERWTADWDKPFLAEWRMAVSDGSQAYSRTWTVKALGDLGGLPLPVGEEGKGLDVPGAPPSKGEIEGVMYAWERDAVTPANTLTPADVLLSCLGVSGYLSALDVPGVRGWRSGEPPTPFKVMVLHGPDWHPAQAVLEEDEFGVLEVMGSVFPVGTPGVRALVDDLGNDAIAILRGMDTRVAEYEQFLQDLTAFCEKSRTECDGPLLASVQELVQQAIASCKDKPRTGIEQAQESLERVKKVLGARDALTLTLFGCFCHLPGNDKWADMFDEFFNYLAAPEGRLWYGDRLRFELWYDDDFSVFGHRCRKLLSERLAILSQYRNHIKDMRDTAARAVVADASCKPLSEALRAKTRGILRNRFYLEQDWRGETPLPSGVLP